MVREYLSEKNSPTLRITKKCTELIRCLPALLFDLEKTEDASSEPHSVTHAPEALRYAVMSRPNHATEAELPDRNFHFPSKKRNPLINL